MTKLGHLSVADSVVRQVGAACDVERWRRPNKIRSTGYTAADMPSALRTPFVRDVAVSLVVNGRRYDVRVSPRTTLLDWLRDRAGLTGIKKGCNEGACGTCTVLVDGQRMNGCLTLLVQADGTHVTTIEGLASPDGALHPVQQAFVDADAFQCGYCTPGQILSAVACIEEGHATDAASVREWMSGNICRCSCYPQIVDAVLGAAKER
jgi:xanthine dehydrogenase YagT iron-sulfur-binding subunit